MQIVERNLEFKKNPQAFIEKYAPEQRSLQQRILRAKEIRGKIEVPKSIIYLASKMCVDLAVDGQRPDIIIAEVAKTVAALEGRLKILPQDALEATKLALNHRTRKGGFEGPATSEEIEEAFKNAMHLYQNVQTKMDGEKEVGAKQGQQREKSAPSPLEAKKTKSLGTLGQVKMRAANPLISFLCFLAQGILLAALWLLLHPENPLPSLVVFSIPLAIYLILYLWWRGMPYFPVPRQRLPALPGLRGRLSVKKEAELFKGEGLAEKLKAWIDSRFRVLPGVRVRSSKRSFLAGKRSVSLTTVSRGRYRFYEKPPNPPTSDIALIPTMKTAAISGHIRRGGAPLLHVQPEDIRTKVRVYRAPITLVLVLDVSESMVNSLGALAKAVSLLSREAYRKRDRIALIAFKEKTAYVLNHPTTNIHVVAGNIRRLGASGSTPLAEGMMKALEVIRQDRRRNKDMIPLVVVISDFLPNIPLKIPGRGIDAIADTLYVAQLLKREKTPVVVINTFHFTPEFGVEFKLIKEGTPLAMEIARITGGRYYGFARGMSWRGGVPIYIDSKKVEEIILEATHDTNFLTPTPATPTSPLSIKIF